MDHRKEAAVRARAYQLWVESGYADGYQDQHWRQAEREVEERGSPEPSEGGDAPAGEHPARTAQPAHRHADGMSRHPSVLDPAPDRSVG